VPRNLPPGSSTNLRVLAQQIRNSSADQRPALIAQAFGLAQGGQDRSDARFVALGLPAPPRQPIPVPVDGSWLNAGSVDPMKLGINQISILGLTLTDNNPGAGQVHWTACTVYWQGNSYAVVAGQTAATAGNVPLYIQWSPNAPLVFTSSATYSPNTLSFLVAVNYAGVTTTLRTCTNYTTPV